MCSLQNGGECYRTHPARNPFMIHPMEFSQIIIIAVTVLIIYGIAPLFFNKEK